VSEKAELLLGIIHWLETLALDFNHEVSTALYWLPTGPLEGEQIISLHFYYQALFSNDAVPEKGAVT
jgi:hypothetical protein